MPRRSALPPPLLEGPFDRAKAAQHGVGPGRLRDADVLRPYHGVQATRVPNTTLERCRAYAVRLQPGRFFSHVTAAQLLTLPLPLHLERRELLDVAAVHPAAAPHARGVRGHRLRQMPDVVEVAGLPVSSAPETWCQLSGLVTLDDLVVIADAFLTRSDVEEPAIRARLLEVIVQRPRRGASTLRQALQQARRGSASPGETRTRLVLVRGGLPQPELNVPLRSAQGAYLGKGDIVYRAHRVLFEYEGDGHREREQFRYDIERYERFRDAGWTVVRVTADDLRGDRRTQLVLRARRRLQLSD